MPDGLAKIYYDARTWQALLKQVKNELDHLLGKLQEAIDFTPNSATEKKTLLKKLGQRKKELQIEKREITARMRAISTPNPSAKRPSRGVCINFTRSENGCS